MKNNILIAYASDFASFLMEKASAPYIKRVILFGSVARNEASEESDVDIFIEIFNVRNKKFVEAELKKIKDSFIRSALYQNYWLLKGIKNEIKLTIGKLDEWKQLKDSIISNGITLYGKFESAPKNVSYKTIVSWGNVKPESKRVMLSKRLFGYKKGKKTYEGLLQKYKGEKIGKGTIVLPLSNEKPFLQLFRDMNITIKIRKIMEYS